LNGIIFSKGEVVLKKGDILGPAEIGILATVGITKYNIFTISKNLLQFVLSNKQTNKQKNKQSINQKCILLFIDTLSFIFLSVPIVSFPSVAILSTGDELVPPECTPGPG
jgi:molybdopterin biosynthesis enzyme